MQKAFAFMFVCATKLNPFKTIKIKKNNYAFCVGEGIITYVIGGRLNW